MIWSRYNLKTDVGARKNRTVQWTHCQSSRNLGKYTEWKENLKDEFDEGGVQIVSNFLEPFFFCHQLIYNHSSCRYLKTVQVNFISQNFNQSIKLTNESLTHINQVEKKAILKLKKEKTLLNCTLMKFFFRCLFMSFIFNRHIQYVLLMQKNHKRLS